MKKITFLTIIIALGLIEQSRAQEISASLNNAETAYAANNPQEARQNLQQALIDLNVLIGNKVLALMPPTLGGLEVNKEEETVIGGTGFAGLIIGRQYGSGLDKNIDITLTNDSPMMSMVSSYLNNDMLSGLMGSQTGQKRINISGYKGMLEKSDADEAGPVNYTINIPVDDTLITFTTIGFDSENEVLAMAEKINLNKIMSMLK